jgi:ElaB/YqjD/DUF883 family membrane-anchored ribosome-binding protein
MNERQNSVEELRRRSETARAELAGTVGELRDRMGDTASEIKTLVSPSHIKHEIKSYIREERESLRQSLERRIRENPLQAAAVGAAIAYPAWGLLRAIPTPLLLIGAGLWLTSSKGRTTANQITAAAADVAEQATERASELADDMRMKAHDIRSGIAERADAVTRKLTETGDAISSRAGELTQKARGVVDDMRNTSAAAGASVSDATGGMTERAAQSFSRAQAGMSQAASRAQDGISQAARKSQSAVMDFVDRNPLLVAGVGVAVGAFIAASLPPSDTENRLFGERADDLKDKARDGAAQGLDRVKDAAAGVMGEVAHAAVRQGLDGGGLQKAAETVTQGAKSVAERGMRAAMGEKSSKIQSTEQS